MKRLKRLIRGDVLLFFFYLFFGALILVIVLDDARKPVVYVSAPTGKIVKVEVNGMEVPVDELRSRRYHRVWVGPEWQPK